VYVALVFRVLSQCPAGFPRALENLENDKLIFQAWKCPGIFQCQEMSWKKYWRKVHLNFKPVNTIFQKTLIVEGKY
jgi:hypothetical protein